MTYVVRDLSPAMSLSAEVVGLGKFKSIFFLPVSGQMSSAFT